MAAGPQGAPAAPASRGGALRQALSEWAGSEGRAWIFVAKTVCAALLALWIAFRLGFDSPRSAMLTVFIVAQPQTGLVLAKSFWRAIGTLVGCLATFVLVGAFSQERELFLLAMSIWVGLCTAGAALFRNFRAYAFILAGYTACLIGFPSALHPQITFSTAVFRVSEVMLGILCAGLITDLVLPQRLGLSLVNTVRGGYKEFLGFVVDALRGRLDHATQERSHNHFVANVIAFEALRDAAYFENPDARVRSGRMRLYNAEYMAATTSFHMLHQMMQRLRRRQCHHALRQLAQLYRELSEVLLPEGGAMPATAAEAAPLAGTLQRYRDGLPQRVAAARQAIVDAADVEELLDF
ncbi:MAG: FUSC family protein, partial [Nevskia sp.]|nr:FUSC family protein [Nevskia sp.]